MTVELQESTKLADVVNDAPAGEEVIVTRDGKIVARLIAEPETQTAARKANRRFGFLKKYGFTVPDDIKTPFQEDIEKMFYGDDAEHPGK